MTDKGYYDPPRTNGHDPHENGAVNGRDGGTPVMLLDGSTVPSRLRDDEHAAPEAGEESLPEEAETDEISGAQEADPANVSDSCEGGETAGEEMGEDAGSEAAQAVETAAPVFTDEERWRHLRMGEALLFASAEPLRTEQIADRLPDGADVDQVLADLQEHYRERGVHLMRVAGGWAFRTATDLAFLMERERVEQKKLSRAALETLAIIAYHQPVTRAEIEDVRGVSVSKGTLDVLMEIGWIRVRGRRQTPGRPVTYGTSDEFLEHFGLDRISDLPGLDELKAAGLLDTHMPTNIHIPRPSDEDNQAGSEDSGDEEEPLYAPDDEVDDDRFGMDPDTTGDLSDRPAETEEPPAGDDVGIDADAAGENTTGEFDNSPDTDEMDADGKGLPGGTADGDGEDNPDFAGNGHDAAGERQEEPAPDSSMSSPGDCGDENGGEDAAAPEDPEDPESDEWDMTEPHASRA